MRSAEAIAALIAYSQEKGWLKARDVQSAIWPLRSFPSPQVRFLFRRLEAQGIGATRGTAEALEWCFILPPIGPGGRKEFLG